ncbi:MAG: sugar kinase [Phycisphaerae bacterium]|nr:sugar kinase [Phycisphaerae bacterium]
MSLVVTGSIGIDTVTTPFGKLDDCLGGSAIYFSMAANFFSPVRFLGVVGEDCPFDLPEFFAGRNVDLEGLEVRKGSKTFRWQGSYSGNMDEAVTEGVELNVLAEQPPVVPDGYKDSEYVFLANTAPALQIQLLNEFPDCKLSVADTMNLWIETAKDDLLALMTKIDGLVLNEGEATMLTGEHNLATAAGKILEMGPEFVVIKKGQHGTLLRTKDGQFFALPAWPTEDVKDPTGAGDSFAGGMMGYLANAGKFDLETLKAAIAYGTCTASLVIEDFSLNRWAKAGKGEIDSRLEQLRAMMKF